MAKLINVLAVSVGTGLMLGAGIRLGEAIAGGATGARREDGSEGPNAARLQTIEGRLRKLEAGDVSDAGARMEKQAAELASIRSRLGVEGQQIQALSEIGTRLRGELQGWLEENVDTRMADVHSKLRAETERSQKQMLDAFAEGMQTRVMQRITRLEEEVAGQSAAMTELRECSLRTEQSMQKLLGGIDRLIVAQPGARIPEVQTQEVQAQEERKEEEKKQEEVSGETRQPAEQKNEPEATPPAWELKPPASLTSEEPQRKSRRWSIFG